MQRIMLFQETPSPNWRRVGELGPFGKCTRFPWSKPLTRHKCCKSCPSTHRGTSMKCNTTQINGKISWCACTSKRRVMNTTATILPRQLQNSQRNGSIVASSVPLNRFRYLCRTYRRRPTRPHRVLLRLRELPLLHCSLFCQCNAHVFRCIKLTVSVRYPDDSHK